MYRVEDRLQLRELRTHIFSISSTYISLSSHEHTFIVLFSSSIFESIKRTKVSYFPKTLNYNVCVFTYISLFLVVICHQQELTWKSLIKYCFSPKNIVYNIKDITRVLTRSKNNKLCCRIEICFEDIFIAHHFLKKHSLVLTWKCIIFSKL